MEYTYPLLVFIHVLASFLFVFAHGVSVFVMLQFRHERNIERLRVLLSLRKSAIPVMSGAAVALLIAGLIAGFMGRWWSRGWIGVSLVLFLALAFGLSAWARGYFGKLERAVNPGTNDPAAAPASPEEIDALLRAGPFVELTVVGLVGLGIIIWLMMYKPF